MKIKTREKVVSSNFDIKSMLYNLRGFTQEEVDALKNPTKASLLDPFDLEGMPKAVNMFLTFLTEAENAKIFIQVDSDVDGLTSAALMHNFCKYLFEDKIEIVWNMHEAKQHGINLKVIPEDANFIIIPDAGSNDYEQQKILNDQNKCVLILDHHAISDGSNPPELENVALVNNQLSPKYKNKSLSGVGVSYKFCEAVIQVLNQELQEELNIDWLMDLVAVGLVADAMVTTIPENAYYIKNGLNNIVNDGLMGLIEVQSFSLNNRKELTITDVSFYIAPLINAVFRVGRPDDKNILFTAFINGRAMVPSSKRGASSSDVEVAAKQAARHASNTKKRQATALTKALDLAELQIKQKINDRVDFLKNSKGLFIVFSEGTIERTLTGLIAIKLLVKYNKPTFILVENAEGYISGSVRSEVYEHIEDFREFCHNNPNVDFAEGHPCAFGVGFKNKEQLEAFKSDLEIKSAGQDFEPVTYVDFEIPANILTSNFVQDIAAMQEIYGKGFEEPKIAVMNAEISADKFLLMGANANTIKFMINGVSCIRFKDDNLVEAIQQGMKTKQELEISFIGRCGLNEWMGNVTPQIIIENVLNIERKYRF